MNNFTTRIDENYLHKLVFDNKLNRDSEAYKHYQHIASNLLNKKVVEDFFYKYLNKPEVLKKRELLNLAYVFVEFGDLNSLMLLIKVGMALIDDEESTSNIIDSISDLMCSLKLEQNTDVQVALNNYMINVLDKYKGNRKIVIFDGIAVILERWHPELIRVNGREYWDYSEEEISDMITTEMNKLTNK